jgi:hypothetical protein
MLRDVTTKEEHLFHDLEGLVFHLRTSMGQVDDPPKPPREL